MFPTDPDEHTVVSSLTFSIGDRQVQGKVQEKERAKERYEDAIAGGNAAILMEESEKDKDLLKMTIGGVQTGQEVVVRVGLIKQLEVEAGSYCLRVPTSYFIKYGNSNAEGPQVNVGMSAGQVEQPKAAEYSFKI